MKSNTKRNEGFTLVELMVVIAIVALIASVALVALMSARQKSRNTKRLADMVQMNNALELYNATYKGYPSSTAGIPSGLIPEFMATIPQDPAQGDGVCANLDYPSTDPITMPPSGVSTSQYYYKTVGSPYIINGVSVYPSYYYYFCLSSDTGNFTGGIRKMAPSGLQ